MTSLFAVAVILGACLLFLVQPLIAKIILPWFGGTSSVWSAALVLLRGFGRLDVFPPGDVGAARGLGPLLQLDPGMSIDRAVERFGDRRGYLYFFGLGAQLQARGLLDLPEAP